MRLAACQKRAPFVKGPHCLDRVNLESNPADLRRLIRRVYLTEEASIHTGATFASTHDVHATRFSAAS